MKDQDMPAEITVEGRLALLRKEHARVARIKIGGKYDVLMRPPTRAQFDSWSDSEHDTPANRRLVLDCVAYPDEAGVLAILDEYPAARKSLVESALTLAGVGKAEVEIYDEGS